MFNEVYFSQFQCSRFWCFDPFPPFIFLFLVQYLSLSIFSSIFYWLNTRVFLTAFLSFLFSSNIDRDDVFFRLLETFCILLFSSLFLCFSLFFFSFLLINLYLSKYISVCLFTFSVFSFLIVFYLHSLSLSFCVFVASDFLYFSSSGKSSICFNCNGWTSNSKAHCRDIC